MKRIIMMLTVSALASPLFAAADGGFGIDAFNRTVGASTRGNAVFSPASFEFDGVVLGEAFGALIRAKYAETMGVLNGLEATYRPKYETLSQSSNGVSFVSARGFCLPDERKSNPAYRQWLQNSFSAEAFTFAFKKGAECWFRARMDGDMEDFSLPENAVKGGNYSYYDLVSVRTEWENPFPANGTRNIAFHLDGGRESTVAAISDRRPVDFWKRRRLSILRLALADNSWFFALIPNEGNTVRDLRAELSSKTLLGIVAGFTSLAETGISHSISTVVIPKMDIKTECDLKQAFGYFRLPLSDMDRIEKNIQPRFIKQCVRYRLDEKGVVSKKADESDSRSILYAMSESQNYVLDRPFIFFVYHGPSATIPVAGVFMGQ